MTNRFKGLDLIAKIPEELWAEIHDIIQDLFKKIGDSKGIFNAKMGTIKDRNGMDLTEA